MVRADVVLLLVPLLLLLAHHLHLVVINDLLLSLSLCHLSHPLLLPLHVLLDLHFIDSQHIMLLLALELVLPLAQCIPQLLLPEGFLLLCTSH